MSINKDTFLQKKFKGRYIENLQDFIYKLDETLVWDVRFFGISSQRKSKPSFFFNLYCERTNSNILIKVHLIQNKCAITNIDLLKIHLQNIHNQRLFMSGANVGFVIDQVFTKECLMDVNNNDSYFMNIHSMIIEKSLQK
jgi:hypothetical protein